MLRERAYRELIVVARGRLVPAARVYHGNVAAVVLLHIFVIEAELAQQLDPTNFKPDEEIGMIRHAHLIGFRVTYAQANFVHRTAMGRAQCPLHCGLRFSKNAVMPSRKSRVVRMRALSITA